MRIRAAAPRLLDPLDRRLVSRDETGLVDEEAAGPDQDPEAVAPQEREADDNERRDALAARCCASTARGDRSAARSPAP